MSKISYLESLSKATESILHSPFEWCYVEGGSVILENATQDGGTKGGTFQVSDFAIAKYPIPSGGNIHSKQGNGGKIIKTQNLRHSMVLICLALVPVGLTVWHFVFGFLPN
jgi:hypothetical protein